MQSVEGILEILDQATEAFVFPMLDNGYVYPAAVRLHCFRGGEGWAIVFEKFGYSPRSGVPDLHVTAIGEGLIKSQTRSNFASDEAFENFERNNRFWRQDFFRPLEGEDWIDEELMESMRTDVSYLVLRGREVPAPDMAKLSQIDKDGRIGDPFHVANVIRSLAEDYRDDVLATPLEVRTRIPSHWQHLVTLEEWHHPDIVDPECKPSGSPTMRSVAEVIVSEDCDRYHGQEANTHWSNWPEGGTL